MVNNTLTKHELAEELDRLESEVAEALLLLNGADLGTGYIKAGNQETIHKMQLRIVEIKNHLEKI